MSAKRIIHFISLCRPHWQYISGPKSHTILHKSDIPSTKQIFLFPIHTPIVNRISSPYHTSMLWCTRHVLDGCTCKPQGLHSLNLSQTNYSAVLLVYHTHHTSWPWISGLFEVLHGHIGCCLLCCCTLTERVFARATSCRIHEPRRIFFSQIYSHLRITSVFPAFHMTFCYVFPTAALHCPRGDHPQKWNCTTISIYSMS